MRRLLFAVLLFAACRCATSKTLIERARIDDAMKRNVVIKWGDPKIGNYCSGFIYSTGVILTAGHCFGDGMTVNGVAAVVVRRDVPHDLLELRTATGEFPAIPIIRADVAEVVFTVANRAPWVDIFSYGYVARVEDGYVCARILSVPGYSGAPLLTADGNLLGVIIEMNSAIQHHTNTDGTEWRSTVPMWAWAVSGPVLKQFMGQQ